MMGKATDCLKGTKATLRTMKAMGEDEKDGDEDGGLAALLGMSKTDAKEAKVTYIVDKKPIGTATVELSSMLGFKMLNLRAVLSKVPKLPFQFQLGSRINDSIGVGGKAEDGALPIVVIVSARSFSVLDSSGKRIWMLSG